MLVRFLPWLRIDFRRSISCLWVDEMRVVSERPETWKAIHCLGITCLRVERRVGTRQLCALHSYPATTIWRKGQKMRQKRLTMTMKMRYSQLGARESGTRWAPMSISKVNSTRFLLATSSLANHFLEIVGPPQDDEISDSDVEITKVKTNAREDKVAEVGEKVKWSDEESDNVYQKFKEKKSTKRKKAAATKKKLTEEAKTATANRKKQRNGESGEPAKKKQRVWGDASDDEDLVDMEMPDYFLDRRREFDQDHKRFENSALQIPPSYEDIYFSDDERIAELRERPDFPASIERSRPYKDIELPNSLGVIPASIAQYLREYQVKGVGFLHELFVYQKGGILGDDMGLGKTVQVAAFLTAAFGKTGDERDDKRMRKMRRAGKRWYPRVLIVCPGSLIQNWENELKRWGWWHIDKYHQKDREDVLETAKAGRSEVVITTYHTYRNHKEDLNLVPWDCVVADECHTLKEIKSATTEAMNEVNALCRIGLTGTAIQNKYEELWTLLNWCNPGRFGPLSTWKTSISGPLRQGQSHDATFHQLKQARETANKLVNNLLPEFFLRRMKSLIAHQLPKKTDKVIFCPLTDIQREAYELFLESEIVEAVKYSTAMCECESGKKRGWCCHVTVAGTDTPWKVGKDPRKYLCTNPTSEFSISRHHQPSKIIEPPCPTHPERQ